MVTTIESIGLGIGIVSLLIAIYSVFQNRKLEIKLKDKEKLKMIAKRTDNIIHGMILISKITEPTIDESEQLHHLSQRIISEAFDKKKDIITLSIKTRISLKVVTSEGKEEHISEYIDAEKKDDVIKYLEEGKLDFVDISTDFGDIVENENLSFIIAYNPFNILHFFYELKELEKEYGDIVEEFNPMLLKSLKDSIKGLFMVALYSKEIEIDIKAFSKTDDIGLWIYKTIMRRDEISHYLVELVEFKMKFENLRESLITTSYA